MDKEYSSDIITLIDNDGNEMEFEILDFIKNEKGSFYALLPDFKLPDDLNSEDEETYFIFESKKLESNNEENLEEVEDEAILDELSLIFEKRFNENMQLTN